MKNISTITLFVVFTITSYLYPQNRIMNELHSFSFNLSNTSYEQIIKQESQANLLNKIENISRLNKIKKDGYFLAEKLSQYWDGLNWVNASKDSFTYDGNSNLIEDLLQDWNSSSSNWYIFF